MPAEIPDRGDVIVVGAGPAGAVAARSLAETGRRVVLVEAGPGGPRPATLTGLDLVAASQEGSRFWPGLVARDRPDGRPRPYRQGWGLGGGSMVNGMLLTPGDDEDYRRWEVELGCAGWGPDQIRPWLDRALAGHRTRRTEPGPVSRALATAATDAGVSNEGATSLDANRLGVLRSVVAAADDRRWSAADAHLGGDGAGDGLAVRRVDPVPLAVVTGAPVVRIEPGRGRSPHRVVLADGTRLMAPLVVLAAGALGTPTLLLRSGLTARPVGAGLRDHPSYAFTLVLRPDRVTAPEPSGPDRIGPDLRVVSTLVRWSSGPDSVGDLQAIAIDRVDPIDGDGPPLASVAVGLMAASSQGSISLPSPTPSAPTTSAPEVVTGALSTEHDRRRLREGVRRVGHWLASEAISELASEVHLDDRGTPLDRLDGLGDEQLDALIAANPGPYAHPASTCRLGADHDRATVAHAEPGRAGQLVGYPGLRVVDSSVLPDLIRGGPQLVVSAVAARLTDDIIASER